MPAEDTPSASLGFPPGLASILTPSDGLQVVLGELGGLAVDEDDQPLGASDGWPHRADARRAAVGKIQTASTALVREALELCEFGDGHLHRQHQQESDK